MAAVAQRLVVERGTDRVAQYRVVRQLRVARADAEALLAADDDDVGSADRDVHVVFNLEHDLLRRHDLRQVHEFLAALGARRDCQLFASDVDFGGLHLPLLFPIDTPVRTREIARTRKDIGLERLTSELSSLTLAATTPG